MKRNKWVSINYLLIRKVFPSNIYCINSFFWKSKNPPQVSVKTFCKIYYIISSFTVCINCQNVHNKNIETNIILQWICWDHNFAVTNETSIGTNLPSLIRHVLSSLLPELLCVGLSPVRLYKTLHNWHKTNLLSKHIILWNRCSYAISSTVAESLPLNSP